jgi:peptidyl-tRNA hydrolase, PTH2 family
VAKACEAEEAAGGTSQQEYDAILAENQKLAYRITHLTRSLSAIEGDSDWDSESSDDGRNPPIEMEDDKVMREKYPLADADELKMVLVINNGLKMGKGKVGAQCGHGTLNSFMRAQEFASKSKYWLELVRAYLHEGQKKICVKVDTEDQLIEVHEQANALGVPNYLVADAGHTQIAAGSLTVCGIGPAPQILIDKLTGHLKLV